MVLAIHERRGSFSDRWIQYCIEKNVRFRTVNCYDNDIIDQLKDCRCLLWHWRHDDYRDQILARPLIASVEKMGLKVFPSMNTCWHYDDKLAQKYLLESISAPLVSSYVFYDKSEALDWAGQTSYPKVFKLRGGAGSANVKLITNKNIAAKCIKRAFSKGYALASRWSNLRQRAWILKRDCNLAGLTNFGKGLVRLAKPRQGLNLLPDQKGYIYFQDFLPGNTYDDRIVVVGEKAFALRRYVRKNDFRASGSGMFEYDKDLFDTKTIAIAFDVAQKLQTQSLAFDFINDAQGRAMIVEISYTYAMGKAYDNCPGYWDRELNWISKSVNPQIFIIENLLSKLEVTQ